MLKREAQERHKLKTRLPRTAEKLDKQRMKSELGDLGIEFDSDAEDEVCTFNDCTNDFKSTTHLYKLPQWHTNA